MTDLPSRIRSAIQGELGEYASPSKVDGVMLAVLRELRAATAKLLSDAESAFSSPSEADADAGKAWGIECVIDLIDAALKETSPSRANP